MRVYISGPITGISDYMEQFEKAEKHLMSEGYSVLNPAKINAQLPSDTKYEEYMKISLTLMDMAEGIYLLKGWQNSLGANREYGFALAKDMVIMWGE